VNMTFHLHVAPRLRMNGAIPLFRLRNFMAWTGRTLPYPQDTSVCPSLHDIGTDRFSNRYYPVTGTWIVRNMRKELAYLPLQLALLLASSREWLWRFFPVLVMVSLPRQNSLRIF
jgi:hypothetical protein